MVPRYLWWGSLLGRRGGSTFGRVVLPLCYAVVQRGNRGSPLHELPASAIPRTSGFSSTRSHLSPSYGKIGATIPSEACDETLAANPSRCSFPCCCDCFPSLAAHLGDARRLCRAAIRRPRAHPDHRGIPAQVHPRHSRAQDRASKVSLH